MLQNRSMRNLCDFLDILSDILLVIFMNIKCQWDFPMGKSSLFNFEVGMTHNQQLPCCIKIKRRSYNYVYVFISHNLTFYLVSFQPENSAGVCKDSIDFCSDVIEKMTCKDETTRKLCRASCGLCPPPLVGKRNRS